MQTLDLHQVGCRSYARIASNVMRRMDLETDLGAKGANSLQSEEVRDVLQDAMRDISRLARGAVRSFQGREPYAEHSPWHERKDGIGFGRTGGPKGVTDVAADRCVSSIAQSALCAARGRDITTQVAIYQGTFAMLSTLGAVTTPALGAGAASLLQLHDWRMHHDNDFVKGEKPAMTAAEMRAAGDTLLLAGARALKRAARELEDPTALALLSTRTDVYNRLAALTAAVPPPPPVPHEAPKN